LPNEATDAFERDRQNQAGGWLWEIRQKKRCASRITVTLKIHLALSCQSALLLVFQPQIACGANASTKKLWQPLWGHHSSSQQQHAEGTRVPKKTEPIWFNCRQRLIHVRSPS
jgi:hypothetical protein